MKQQVERRATVLVLLALMLLPALGRAQAAAQRHYGAAGGVAVAAAPMGELAESYGMPAIAGLEYQLRVLNRSSAGLELSLGLLADEYRTSHLIDRSTSSAFHYRSVAVVAGRSSREQVGGVPMRFGLELGWRRFNATSSRPDFYTSNTFSSNVRGDAALLGVVYGIEISSGSTLVVPRVRLETSYPDFGGGDGYSRLHRESDIGFRASVGLEVSTVLFGGERVEK